MVVQEGDGVQGRPRGSVASSSPAYAATAPCHPHWSGLGGEPRLL